MPRDQLSDAKLRSTKPAAKPSKLFDGGGLFLLVHPNGSRYWRLKYRRCGKEKLFAIGVYPEVSLSEARAKALEAKSLIRGGSDPGSSGGDTGLPPVGWLSRPLRGSGGK